MIRTERLGRGPHRVDDRLATHGIEQRAQLPAEPREQLLRLGTGCDGASGLTAREVETDGAGPIVRERDGADAGTVEPRERGLGTVDEALPERPRREHDARDPSGPSSHSLVAPGPRRR